MQTAKIIKQPEVITKKDGEKRLVINIDVNGVDSKIWADPADAKLRMLDEGQFINVKSAGKFYQFVSVADNVPQPTENFPNYFQGPKPLPPSAKSSTPSASPIWSEPEKREKLVMMEAIRFDIGLYKFCYDEAGKVFDDYALGSEDLRTIATTMFIQNQRRFNF